MRSCFADSSFFSRYPGIRPIALVLLAIAEVADPTRVDAKNFLASILSTPWRVAEQKMVIRIRKAKELSKMQSPLRRTRETMMVP